MPKWAKFFIAILLLPLCVGAVAALMRVLRATGGAEHFWVPFIGRAACWLMAFPIVGVVLGCGVAVTK